MSDKSFSSIGQAAAKAAATREMDKPRPTSRAAASSLLFATIAEHVSTYDPEAIVEKLASDNGMLDGETREKDRANLRKTLRGMLALVAQEDRPRAIEMIGEIADRLLEKRIGRRAICNHWLDKIGQNLDKAGGGIKALEELRNFYSSPAFDGALKGLEEWSRINYLLATLSGGPQARAAEISISESVKTYEQFKMMLEEERLADAGLEMDLRRMKEHYVLSALFSPERMAEAMRGSLIRTPLRLNIAFFSIAEVAYLASVAAAPYAAEANPNEIRISAAISNSLQAVLSLSESMPAGSRLDVPRLLVHISDKVPEALRIQVPALIRDAVENLRKQERPPEQNEAQWLERMWQHFGQFQADERETACASLAYITKNPASVFDSD